jgi:hypothetical protein
MGKRCAAWCLSLILTIHIAILIWGARSHSPTIDEIAYLPAGLSYWQLGRFELANVSPPLVPLIAATPVLAVGAQTNWLDFAPAPGALISHAVGMSFLAANGPRLLWLFTLARWALIPLSVVGALTCYFWARDLSGHGAGLLSATLWCFCPNILAHAQLVTTDVGASALGAAATYTFWRWMKRPSWQAALIAGVALGFAESAKTTLIMFVILWPLLWLIGTWPKWRTMSFGDWKKIGSHLGVMLVLSWYILNLVYAFDGSFKPLGRFTFVSRALVGADVEIGGVGNRFAGTWLGRVPIPFPEQYVLGIDLQKRDLENVDPTYHGGLYRSYLRGEWRTRGWWYYYLYGLAVKVPMGTWFLVLIAIWSRARAARGVMDWRDDFVLLVPLATILVLVSSQTGFNTHLRYVLPILPFAFVWTARSIQPAVQGSARCRLAFVAALSWSIASSLWIAPHHLSYFNELAGGPRNGHFHLLDSNIDWGQDLLYFRSWAREHPQAQPIRLAYLGRLDPRIIGMDYPSPSVSGLQASSEPQSQARLTVKPGWYAISIGYVRGDLPREGRHLDVFQKFKPTSMAGYSIYIYHITSEESDTM